MNAHIKAHLNPSDTGAVAVLARALSLPQDTALQGTFVYMPAGSHSIEATVNGQPGSVMVDVDAAAATILNDALQARLATGVKPSLDYNHEGARASGWPLSFHWQEGDGVMCKVEWTPAARDAIRAGEWRYFSPEFRINRTTQKVIGLRATGPLGGLVNDPAFRAMPAIQARHSAPTNNLPDPNPAPEPPPTHPHNMNEKVIVAALIAAGFISTTEAAGDNAATLITARINDWKQNGDGTVKAAHTTALTERDDTIKTLRAEIGIVKTREAEAEISTAVKAGCIPAQDKATQDFWKASILAQGEVAVKALRALPGNKVLKATGSTTTEETPVDEDLGDEAQAAAISARAVHIASERRVSFQQAWPIAEAEVKARHN